MIAKEKLAAMRAAAITASFTAWQVRAAQGEKISWSKYLNRLGLGTAEPGGCDNKKAVQTAAEIHKRILAHK